MVDLDLLSPNLILILGEIINNQNLLKYIVYSDDNPLAQGDLDLPYKSILGGADGQLFPYPFDSTTETVDKTNIRAFYPEGQIHGGQYTAETFIYFDIIVAKSLWLINDGENSQIRPYKIMTELINTFKGKSLSTVGRLIFHEFVHMSVNKSFDAIRLTATMDLMKQGD